jgi:SAM-dependent methyltransferase
MKAIWDSEWSITIQHNVANLLNSEHWSHIQRYLTPPARLLEAGCGIAKWVKFLKNHGYDVYGLDFSKVAIDSSLNIWPDLKLHVGDLRCMPFENSFFEGIISFGAIEHDEEGPDAALREMFRVLRPGGFLYCTVPCMNRLRRLGLMAIQDWVVRNPAVRRLTGRKPEVVFYEYLFTLSEYRKILSSAGFEVIDVIPLSPMELILGNRTGGLRWRFFQHIHQRFPWTLAHMMAAICRKPRSSMDATAG